MNRHDTDDTPAPVLAHAVAPARIDRVPRTEPSRQPASVSAPEAIPSTERRLKQIIERAPVSLMILDPSGQCLAANGSALALLGISRLDSVVGTNIGALVAMEDCDHFRPFVAGVCRGQTGSLEYEVVRADNSRLALETHAVAIRRTDSDAAVFLGASWDVSARHRSAAALEELETKCALAESDRDALRTALEEASAATSSIAGDRALERSQADEAIRRLQAALTEASDRHARLASEWAVERETLMIRLARLDEENADLTSELGSEQAGREKLEVSERECRLSLERAAEEHARLRQEWLAIEARHQADLATSRTERDQLVQAIQEMNKSYAALVSERTTERTEFEAVLRTERSRHAELVGEREQWRADLAAILRGVTDAGMQTQQLLDRCRNIRLVSTDNQGKPIEPVEPSEASAVATGTGT